MFCLWPTITFIYVVGYFIYLFFWSLVSVSYHGFHQYFPQCLKASFGFQCVYSHQGIFWKSYSVILQFWCSQTSRASMVGFCWLWWDNSTVSRIPSVSSWHLGKSRWILKWRQTFFLYVQWKRERVNNSGLLSNILVSILSHRWYFRELLGYSSSFQSPEQSHFTESHLNMIISIVI